MLQDPHHGEPNTLLPPSAHLGGGQALLSVPHTQSQQLWQFTARGPCLNFTARLPSLSQELHYDAGPRGAFAHMAFTSC